MNSVVEIAMDALTVLLHVFLKLLPSHVGPEVPDLPDSSPGPHVLRPLGESVSGARSQHDLCCLLSSTLLTTLSKESYFQVWIGNGNSDFFRNPFHY